MVIHGMNRQKLVWILGIYLIALFAQAVETAKAEGSIPASAVRVAGGMADGSTWSIWVFGRSREDVCWGIMSRGEGDSASSEVVRCGFSRAGLPWRLAVAGKVGADDRAEVLRVFLVRSKVTELKIRVMQKGVSRRVSLAVRRLTRDEVERSGFARDVGVVVALLPRRVGCIESIEAIGRGGENLGEQSFAGCSG